MTPSCDASNKRSSSPYIIIPTQQEQQPHISTTTSTRIAFDRALYESRHDPTRSPLRPLNTPSRPEPSYPANYRARLNDNTRFLQVPRRQGDIVEVQHQTYVSWRWRWMMRTGGIMWDKIAVHMWQVMIVVVVVPFFWIVFMVSVGGHKKPLHRDHNMDFGSRL
ncbi:hypothetical protein GQ44DRAFT_724743 [Phaeosphaeriaceae sp. PMI808]|nr:hypothetical protein GQ44DRAFT_724743 [Phaeosphaeriaceae sp. PMI808]